MTAPNTSLVDRLRSAQPAIIEAFTLLSPYAAAALPAALSGGNVTRHIMPANSGAWGGVVGFMAGAGLEMIGIACGWVVVNIISRTRNVPLSKNWKLLAAIYAGAHYVAANLAANVGVVAFGSNSTTLAIATGALSTMSVPAVIVSVLWALEIDERKVSSAADDSKKAAAKDANALAFEQGMARMKLQNEHELAQLQARAAAELAIAQERTKQLELERTAPAPQPAAIDGQAPAVDPKLAALVAEFRASNASSKSISGDLCRYLHGLGYTNTQIATATGIHITGVGKHIKAKAGG